MNEREDMEDDNGQVYVWRRKVDDKIYFYLIYRNNGKTKYIVLDVRAYSIKECDDYCDIESAFSVDSKDL